MARTNEFATFFVPNLEALALVHAAEIGDGSLAWVESLKTYYSLDKFSGLPADGINVIEIAPGAPRAGVSPTARWIRQSDGVLDGDLQPIWHINEVTGNDQNSGLTSGTAIKTYAEFLRRIGDNIITDQITVFIDSNLNQDINAFFKIGPDGSVIHNGFRTEIRRSTITAVQAYNPFSSASPPLAGESLDGQITDAAIVSWAPFVGKMIELVDRHPTDPPIAWVAKDLGGTVMRFSPFFDPLTFSNTDPVALETYALFDLVQITGTVVVSIEGTGSVAFNDIDFNSTPGDFFEKEDGTVFLANSKVKRLFNPQGSGSLELFASQVYGNGLFDPGTCVVSGNGAFFFSSLVLAARLEIAEHGNLIFVLDNVVQGPDPSFAPFDNGITLGNGGSILLQSSSDEFTTLGFFDVGVGFLGNASTFANLQKGRLWGVNVISIGYNLDSGTSIYVGGSVASPFGPPVSFPLNTSTIAPPQLFEVLVGGLTGTPVTYAAIDGNLGAGGTSNEVRDSRVVVTDLIVG